MSTTTAAARVARLLGEAASIAVLTGAGVSTDSGIPDFRGPQGVWTKNPAAEKLFTIDNYLADPEVRRQAWAARRKSPLWTAKPNAAHRALADFERTGRLRAIVTQNTDGLHLAAGSDPARVIEIHGSARYATCLDGACPTRGARMPMTDVLPRLEAGETDPRCLACGGILKSATISFGQRLDGDVLDAAVEAAREADLFIAIGTSLGVYPAAGLCDCALAHDARLVILNAEPTPYDEVADAVLREPIGEVLPGLLSDA